jgi:hypothetical protein
MTFIAIARISRLLAALDLTSIIPALLIGVLLSAFCETSVPGAQLVFPVTIS